jgi:hypothetical protein
MLLRAITVLALSAAALVQHLHTAAALTDSDLVFTTGSNEKRWQDLRNTSAAWRGSSVRAVWALEHMDAAVAASQQASSVNDTFTAAQDTHHHPFSGDWRFVSLSRSHHQGADIAALSLVTSESATRDCFIDLSAHITAVLQRIVVHATYRQQHCASSTNHVCSQQQQRQRCIYIHLCMRPEVCNKGRQASFTYATFPHSG